MRIQRFTRSSDPAWWMLRLRLNQCLNDKFLILNVFLYNLSLNKILQLNCCHSHTTTVTESFSWHSLALNIAMFCHKTTQIDTFSHKLSRFVTWLFWTTQKISIRKKKNWGIKNFCVKKCHVWKILMSKNVTLEKFCCH